MLVENFNNTINIWIQDLENYSFDELLAKPSEHSWSLGQVYMHVIEETRYYMEQMESCMKYNDNAQGEMDERGKAMFLNNEFPNRQIKGDPLVSEQVPQPTSQSQLQSQLLQLKQEMNEIGERIMSSETVGKAAHPGHGYFTANEWFQYAEMHMRHHLRQKQRLDEANAGQFKKS
jgi:hypothetical protein